MNKLPSVIAFFVGFSLLSSFAQSAPASDSSVQSLMQQIEQQKRMLKAQQEQLARQQKILDAQEARFARMQKQVEAMSGVPLPPERETAAAVMAEAPKDTPVEVGVERKPDEHDKIPDITVLDDTTGVLLPKGRFVVEPSIEYANSSSIRAAIEGFTIIPALTIGALQISEVNRDTFTARLTGRFGLSNRLEADVSVPYLYRRDTTRARPFGVGAASDILTNVSGHDIGDVEAGLHYQVNNGLNGWPIFVANARFKSATGTGPFDVPVDPDTGLQLELPTGSGFYTFQPSATAIFPSDPVVFFGNLGYGFNFAQGTRIGDVDPGDSINTSLGTSLLLNDKLSLSFSYNHDVILRTRLNGSNVPATTLLHVGAVNIGSSYRIYDDMSLNFIAGIGVTEHAPDIRLMVKLPMIFNF